MILSIRYRDLCPPASLDETIEELFLPLGELCRVDRAEVVIEYRAEESPAYAAKVHMEVAGPDLSVEIVDHTPENAYCRAVEELDRRLKDRSEDTAREFQVP